MRRSRPIKPVGVSHEQMVRQLDEIFLHLGKAADPLFSRV
jgi:hypothetical protein